MDNTPVFIKMCEKAVEVQELWNKKDGDFFFTDKVYVWGCYECKKGVWLPRQDQLQGMVRKESIDFWKINHFYHWIECGDCHKAASLQYLPNPASMEMYWLAFVMLENYNKIWNGNDWIKI